MRGFAALLEIVSVATLYCTRKESQRQHSKSKAPTALSLP